MWSHGIILGMKPDKIKIMPFGVSVSFNLKPEDYNNKIKKGNLLELKKIIVAISGPIVNVLLIILFLVLKTKAMAIYANILIMIFNLLPIYPLDGGRILKSCVHILFGGKLAKAVTNMAANVTMIIVSFAGSICVFYYENIAFFIIIIFLWVLVIKENKKYRMIKQEYMYD